MLVCDRCGYDEDVKHVIFYVRTCDELIATKDLCDSCRELLRGIIEEFIEGKAGVIYIEGMKTEGG